MEKTWRDAIIRVLNESDKALHYSDIAELILTNGYYKTDGATPAATVNSHIATSIKTDGAESPFIRVSPGIFSLNSQSPSASSQALSVKDTSKPQKSKSGQDEIEVEAKLINAFGMYWERELVVWKKNPKLLGRSPGGSKFIDFSGQRGIYLLYDHHTPIYVGRSTDQSIGQRLFQHTLGRLAGRWNRFSWFGTLEPDDDGKLKTAQPLLSESALISTYEAILIESLEPPQNRRQGDGFAGCEYIQDIDPEIKKKEIAATLKVLEQKLQEA